MTANTPVRWHAGLAYRALASAIGLGLCCALLTECSHKPPDACSYLSGAIDSQDDGPLFLASYPTAGPGPLHDTAFLYDNALAAIALVDCGEPRRAQRIGDAILAALDHDRFWHDGRLRNAYAAGAVGDGRVKLAGWWDGNGNKWVEDKYQVGSDSGNMAWAMLALLVLDKVSDNRRFRDGALRIGAWVTRLENDKGPGGYTGGTYAHEPHPDVEPWKSTEHNSDITAAFIGLAQVTGDKKWLVHAQAARAFVQTMWSEQCQCFAAGTGEDGVTPNPLLALDAQLFPLLGIPGMAQHYHSAVTTLEQKLRDGGGFSYSGLKGGLWTEGSAQFALFAALSGREAESNRILVALRAMRTSDGSYYAASVKQLATGFTLDTDPAQARQYFRIPHLGATSWMAILQNRVNPFTRTKSLPQLKQQLEPRS